ncbi:transcription activator effector-binding protein [Chryseobacterium shigense]|uniref:Transcriptional regulator, AraC family n=1 Tax=Chryseobacterium shigense TaxID=297244 RepID=A0A1N7IRF2_9FLAO|nr:AraC family transcriptional regulator [Chryseobacterium shigense]PQA95570.1 transcription activator effector-binding protein [Chryseobacterium shigense]SIS39663.1 transcriptional regulator, AraC family [Chryseobacterium shigense]
MPIRFNEIQKIVDHIENNFDREITAAEIEHLSQYSYRNFQRIFFKIFKETISGFQKRLRLEKSYKKLIYTPDKISDIAWEVGYLNIQSFSKAFKKQYHISPAEARNQKQEIFKEFLEREADDLKYEIKYKDAISVYCTFIKAKDYNNQEINDLWSTIGQENGDSFPAYGIVCDQPLITSRSHCRYGAALLQVETGVSGFQKTEIFGGKYIRFTHYGSFENILETYRAFYRFWLTQPNLLLDHSDVIEEYMQSEKGEMITHIYFPLYS